MSPLSNKAAVTVLARSAWSPYKKKLLSWLKRNPHPLDGQHGDLLVMVFPHPPLLLHPNLSPNQHHKMRYDWSLHRYDHFICLHASIFRSSHLAWLRQVSQDVPKQIRFKRPRFHQLSNAPHCVLWCVYKLPRIQKRCVGGFLSSQVIQNKQTDPSLLG